MRPASAVTVDSQRTYAMAVESESPTAASVFTSEMAVMSRLLICDRIDTVFVAVTRAFWRMATLAMSQSATRARGVVIAWRRPTRFRRRAASTVDRGIQLHIVRGKPPSRRDLDLRQRVAREANPHAAGGDVVAALIGRAGIGMAIGIGLGIREALRAGKPLHRQRAARRNLGVRPRASLGVVIDIEGVSLGQIDHAAAVEWAAASVM